MHVCVIDRYHNRNLGKCARTNNNIISCFRSPAVHQWTSREPREFTDLLSSVPMFMPFCRWWTRNIGATSEEDWRGGRGVKQKEERNVAIRVWKSCAFECFWSRFVFCLVSLIKTRSPSSPSAGTVSAGHWDLWLWWPQIDSRAGSWDRTLFSFTFVFFFPIFIG